MHRLSRVNAQFGNHLVSGEWSMRFGVSCYAPADIFFGEIIPECSPSKLALHLCNSFGVQQRCHIRAS